MLTNTFLMVIDAVAGFFTFLLLARFYMQWARVSFHNPLGLFVLKTTDWLVLRLRRVVPAAGALDLSSLLPAVLMQAGLAALVLVLRGVPMGGAAVLVLLGLGFIEVLKISVYLLFGAVLLSAILSWVNPYAPMRGMLEQFTRPFLAPLQKRIPPVANVDLSPLVLLLVLQIVLSLIAQARVTLMPYLL